MSEKLKTGTIEDALELLYWQFDTRRAGTGFRALPDGTKRPQSERDAFKDAVRDLMAERDLVSRRDRSQEFIVYMLLWCPECGERHIDEGEFETKSHHTHACQHCGHCWRPAIGPTCGVRFLPGFKNGTTP